MLMHVRARSRAINSTIFELFDIGWATATDIHTSPMTNDGIERSRVVELPGQISKYTLHPNRCTVLDDTKSCHENPKECCRLTTYHSHDVSEHKEYFSLRSPISAIPCIPQVGVADLCRTGACERSRKIGVLIQDTSTERDATTIIFEGMAQSSSRPDVRC